MKFKKIAAVCLAGVMAASMFTGCGMNKNATLASATDINVTLGFGNFFCRYTQASIDELYRGYFGEDVWSSDIYGYGSTMEDTIKSDVMGTLHDMYTLKNHMSEYGVSLSDAQKQKITEVATEFMNNNPKKTLKEMGASQELVEEMLTLYTIQSVMHEAIIAKADTNVSDEEANMRGYSYIRVSTAGTYDSSYNYVEYTEEEVLDIKNNLRVFYDSVTDSTALETLAEAAEYTVSKGTYDADNTSLDEAVKAALDALSEGEMSEIIETDSYSYILRLDAETDEEATASNRESIIEQRQSDLYDEVLSGWQEDDGWKVDAKALAKITFDDNFAEETETETETQTESK